MTLQEIPSESFRERSIPVLETERLVLRAPRLGDAKTVAVLANDRRIAENTARIPHPYRMADAEDFIATANLGNEAVFFITLRNGLLIGACGFTQVDRHPEGASRLRSQLSRCRDQESVARPQGPGGERQDLCLSGAGAAVRNAHHHFHRHPRAAGPALPP